MAKKSEGKKAWIINHPSEGFYFYESWDEVEELTADDDMGFNGCDIMEITFKPTGKLVRSSVHIQKCQR